jgi:hypothetical protein
MLRSLGESAAELNIVMLRVAMLNVVKLNVALSYSYAEYR